MTFDFVSFQLCFCRSLEWFKLDESEAKNIFFPTLRFKRTKKVENEVMFGPPNGDYFWYNDKDRFFEYQQAFTITFYCPMDFGQYPFDAHFCNFDFGDSNQGNDSLIILPPIIRFDDQKHFFGNDPLIIEQKSMLFDIWLQSRKNYVHFEAGYHYSYTGMRIDFKRNSLGTLMGRFFMPTLVFTILSLISFAVEPDMVEDLLLILIHFN